MQPDDSLPIRKSPPLIRNPNQINLVHILSLC
jgi:hypothetical protein